MEEDPFDMNPPGHGHGASSRPQSHLKGSGPARPRASSKTAHPTSTYNRQSQHHQAPRRRAQKSQFGGHQSSPQAMIIQLATIQKNYVVELSQINAQRQRMKTIEKNVAQLKREERGLGVKKARAQKQKLEAHVEKMGLLVAQEQKARQQAQNDVAALNEEVNIYEKKYAEICREVEGLLAIKQRFEVDIEAKKREFDISIKEQDSRLKSVEEELNGLDKMLIQDNLVRNRIGADKGMVESLIDKLKDLLGKEEDFIEADKEFLLKTIKEIKCAKPTQEVRKRLSSMNLQPGAHLHPSSSASSGVYLAAFSSHRNTHGDKDAPRRLSIVQARESYKARRETLKLDGPPTFF